MLHTVSLGLFLSCLWLLLSGHFHEPLLLGLGLVSVIAVLAVARRMDVIDREGHPVHLSWRALCYWPWLLKEIVMANIHVAKALLRRDMAIDLQVVTVKSSQRSELGRVIYANSITLTPGTVTISIEDDTLAVHALTRGTAEDLAGGEMDRRVTAIEGSS
jgi:multicomponent Na+:H+ antiporter subunit E